jgi:MacB-like periplasmic core domain
MARFSYPDFEAYRDGLRSFSGVIAFSIEQLALSHADEVVTHRRSDTGTLLTRLGLVPPAAVNKEIATTFVVSENYFAVLGVAPVRGRAFDAMNPAELAASPAVLISENYWHDRFAGDPDIVGKIIRLNGAAFAIAGVTPANFTGTSIAVPNFWLPLSLASLPPCWRSRCSPGLVFGLAPSALQCRRCGLLHVGPAQLFRHARYRAHQGTRLRRSRRTGSGCNCERGCRATSLACAGSHRSDDAVQHNGPVSHSERASARWSDVASDRRRSRHARRGSGWE